MNLFFSASRLSRLTQTSYRTLFHQQLRTMSLTASHPNLPENVRSLIDKVQPAPSKGSSEKDQSGVNEWLSRLSKGPVDADLAAINKELLPRTYLVSNELTIADVALYGALHPTMVRFSSFQTSYLALAGRFSHISDLIFGPVQTSLINVLHPPRTHKVVRSHPKRSSSLPSRVKPLLPKRHLRYRERSDCRT
jgi:hypothetical protein